MAVSLAQDCASDLLWGLIECSHHSQSDCISITDRSLTLENQPTGRGSRRTDCTVSGPAQWSMCEAPLVVSVDIDPLKNHQVLVLLSWPRVISAPPTLRAALSGRTGS
jgi:hypothetical protein